MRINKIVFEIIMNIHSVSYVYGTNSTSNIVTNRKWPLWFFVLVRNFYLDILHFPKLYSIQKNKRSLTFFFESFYFFRERIAFVWTTTMVYNWSCNCDMRLIDYVQSYGVKTEKKKSVRYGGIEPPATAWKAIMLPLHQ